MFFTETFRVLEDISATTAVAVPTDSTSLTTTTLPGGATTLAETINPEDPAVGL